MKWTMNTKTLKRITSNSVDFTEKNGVTDTHKSLFFEFADDFAHITATDGNALSGIVSVTDALGLDKVDKGSFLVDAKKLDSIVKNVTTDYIDFELTEKGTLFVRSKKTRYKLATSSADEYVQRPENTAKAFSLGVGKLLYLLNKVTFAASDNAAKSNMRGVFLEAEPGQLLISATDSFQLAHAHIEEESKTMNEAFKSGVFVAKDDAQRLQKVLSGFDPNSSVTIAKDENLMTINYIDNSNGSALSTRVWLRLLNSNFVNYASIFRATSHDVVVNRKALLEVLKKAKPAISKDSPVLKLSKEGNVVTIESNNDATAFRGEISTLYSKEELEVGLSAKFLSNIVSHLDSEKIVLDIHDADSVVQIYRYKEPGIEYERGETYVIMPMEL